MIKLSTAGGLHRSPTQTQDALDIWAIRSSFVMALFTSGQIDADTAIKQLVDRYETYRSQSETEADHE